MKHSSAWILLLAFLLLPLLLTGQSIRGQVVNESGEPIPFVNIFIKTLETGTTTDGNGHYFLTVQPGEYEVAFSSVGYESQLIPMLVGDGVATNNVQLLPDKVQLEEIVIKASKKNPANEIIRKVIAGKDRYLKNAPDYRCQVYLKATEIIEERRRKKPVKEVVSLAGEPMDPFEEKKPAAASEFDKMKLVEMQLTLNFKAPNLYKEERTAYKSYGRPDGLFIPRFGESDFNFYRNLIYLKGIAETPIISPVSRTAILSYKFKLEAAVEENGILVYKIRFSPRKVGNSTCSGYIYVNDGLWNINRLELDLPKGSLKIYDSFRLKIGYQEMPDSTWIINRQEFIYSEKQGRSKVFRGNTLLRYSDRVNHYPFPEKFFGNEIAVVTKEAYERDTLYWQSIRPEALSVQQKKMIDYRDSIQAVRTSKVYLDSVDAEFNKVKITDILYNGIGYRSQVKKRELYISSLPELVEIGEVGGFRIALPYVTYFKKWEDERFIFTSGSINMGLKNNDIQGYLGFHVRYDPHRQGFLYIRTGRSFHTINGNDAYLNLLRTSNFILNDRVDLNHRIELFNGFYIDSRFDYSARKSLEDFDNKTFINRILDDDSAPITFEPYQALITTVTLSYTPGQKYITEPNRKIVLGSPFPTFSFLHKKGWRDVIGSDINFDYIAGRVSQDLILGIFGASKYSFQVGKFINREDLRYVDLRRFRQSDPYLYSDPLSSFQLLDTSLVANGLFFEFHHIHHFNGALINNIPLIKLLRLRAVAGAGVLWTEDDNYRHEEIFAGVERIFKIGVRRRLRIGVFGVLANSNHTGINTGFKVSFDIIDTWKKDWSY